jgi:ABC-type glycerol-3-phosphate transport system permease component
MRRQAVNVWLVRLLRLFVAVVWIVPVYWVLVIATGHAGSAYSLPPVFLPMFRLGPLLTVLQQTHILHHLLNSVFITGTTIVLVLVTGALAGYALAEIQFPGRSLYFLLTLGVMMLPQQALMVPQYIVLFHLHMLNTYASMIVPFAATTATIFLFRQFFMKIPASYREIARIEGVSVLRYLWRVAVPLARPAVSASVLLTFIASWNMFQWPLIMTTSKSIQPLEVALTYYMQAFQAHWRELASAALLALIPIILVFVFTQRYIVSAVAGGEMTQKE